MIQIRRVSQVRNSIKQDAQLLEAFDEIMEQYDKAFTMRYFVHDLLFKRALQGQGTDEQYAKYADDVEHLRIIGCFAMTELGHSSYLRGMETTAEFDVTMQEFVLNTPTLLATKWWMGLVGEVATHAAVLANCILFGKNYGPCWYLVQLRDKHGMLMPGVSAGGVGAKVGRHGLDNGWIQFSQVRIKREDMLMRWNQVTKDGKFIPASNKAAPFAPLISERYAMLIEVYSTLCQSVTIATRFALLRQQGPANEIIMDYQTQQTRLVPIIASCYAIRFTQQALAAKWNNALQNMSKPEFASMIQDHHAMAAGLKTLTTWWTMDSIEMCRRCMGGHAFSAYNAIGSISNDFGVLTTGGGDNFVLAQQQAQYLLKMLRSVMQQQDIGNTLVSYLKNVHLLQQACPIVTLDDCNSTTKLLSTLETLAIASVVNTGKELQGKGLEQLGTLMERQIDMSQVNSAFMIAKLFEQRIQSVPNGESKTILTQLCNLFTTCFLVKFVPMMVEFQYVKAHQVALLRQSLISQCAQLRSRAGHLVNAFGMPDFVIKAPLALQNVADPYQAYFETVKSAPQTPSYWNEIVKPMLSSKL